MADYVHFADLNAQLPDIPPESIISRTLYQDDQKRVILFGFAADQELSEHTSSKAAILHFLKGEARITLGMDEITAQAGTWVHMPPNLQHSIKSTTHVVMLLLMFE